MPSRVAITGGRGLLGRYVVAELQEQGVETVVLTREGRRGSVPNAVATSYEVDSLASSLGDLGIDAVVHLAASRSSERSVGAHISSLTSAQNLFEAATAVGVRDIVYASTIGVYDRAGSLPWSESAAIAPALTYGVMKHAVELLVPQYPRLQVRSLRLGHLYGANEHNDYMINRFMRRAAAGQDIEVNTAASARRDFVYAKDAARGVVQSLSTQAAEGVYNIGSGTPRSSLEMAEAILEGFGSSSRIVKTSDPRALVPASSMDIAKAQRELGYRPTSAVVAFGEIHKEVS